MNEFSNRIEAQRQILRAVNLRTWPQEPLHGLSAKSLSRWVTANRLEPNSKLVELLHLAAAKLFFLANKSQEQVSAEYQSISSEVENLAKAIRDEVGLKAQL
jgi:hypothetical protein